MKKLQSAARTLPAEPWPAMASILWADAKSTSRFCAGIGRMSRMSHIDLNFPVELAFTNNLKDAALRWVCTLTMKIANGTVARIYVEVRKSGQQRH